MEGLTTSQRNGDRGYKFPLSQKPDLEQSKENSFWKNVEETNAKMEAETYFSHENYTFRLVNERPTVNMITGVFRMTLISHRK